MGYYLYEIDGRNRADEEKAALDFLGLDKTEVIFEEVNEKKGLMGIFKGAPSTILILPGDDEIPFESHVRGVTAMVLKKMGVEATIDDVGEKDENVLVEISSPDSGFLIGKHGRTLDAMQFLVNLIVHMRSGNGQRIMLDVEGYRGRREKSLKKLAERMADRVARQGRPMLLNYMNPYERRIVHLELEGDDRVYTESDGNGVYKRVRIYPERSTVDQSDNARSDSNSDSNSNEKNKDKNSGKDRDRGRKKNSSKNPEKKDEHGDFDGNRIEDYTEKSSDEDDRFNR